MVRFFTYSLAFLLLHFAAGAQCDLFRVFSKTGNAFLIEKNSNVKKALAFQQPIRSDQKIVLEEHATVTLFSEKMNTIVLHTKGEYSLRQLKELCKKNQQSLSKKYFNYILTALTEREHEGAQSNAAIERGIGNRMMAPPDSSRLIHRKVTFTWRSLPLDIPGHLRIIHPSGKILLDTTLLDTTLIWAPPAEVVQFNKPYAWLVLPDEIHPPNATKFRFIFADNTWINQFHEDSTAFSNELRLFNLPDSVNQMLIASFYLEKYLYNRVLLIFPDLMKDVPAGRPFPQVFRQYLYRKQL